MKTLNYMYLNKENLKVFINDNYIADKSNVLLQIFTGIIDIVYINNLISIIKEFLPNIKIIGTTTAGEIIGGVVTNNKTILSFSIFEKTKIMTFSSQIYGKTEDVTLNLISMFPLNKKAKVAISFANGLTTNGELFVETFKKYDKDLIISGGLAGDNKEFRETIVFTESEILANGIVVGLLYNDKLIVNNQYILGWKTIGKLLKVTKVNGNIVYEIDNEKIIDIYAKYLGGNIAEQLPDIGMEFPLIIHRNGVRIARTILVKNEDNSFTFAGNLKEGDEITFAYRDINYLNEKRSKIYKKIKNTSSESIFIYSCIARKVVMQNEAKVEIEPISTIANTSGFFTYGEFFSDTNGRNELLNQTMTILSLSESEDELKYNNDIEPSKIITKSEDQRFVALSNLLTQTVLELKGEVEKNREKDKKLIRQSQMAQMGEMLSMIAHQWRQPLGAINSTLLGINAKIEKGMYDLDIAENRTDFLIFLNEKHTKIMNNVLFLSDTIEDFRNFFKLENMKEKKSINFSVEKALKIIGEFLKGNDIVIIKDFKVNEQVYLYQNELTQVILNIFLNSKDNFIEKNIKNRTIKITTDKLNDDFIIKISDNGGGIDEKIVNNIFDPYFSTKGDKNGSGLGLYMSKIIVEKHHEGTLNVRNIENGVCFEIILRRT